MRACAAEKNKSKVFDHFTPSVKADWSPWSWLSPPLCRVASFLQFGRTEVIDNTLNPDFVRKFVLDFFFEEKQNLRFDV